MGLTIFAYKNLKAAKNFERDSDGILLNGNLIEIRNLLIERTEGNFPGRTSGLSEGVYTSDDSFSFEAGTYSDYNVFRDNIEMIVKGSQLHELIMFSDMEGYIGSIMVGI